MFRKQTSYKFRTRKNLIFDYLENEEHEFDMFFVVGENKTKIGCHRLILSITSNNNLLDASMDMIILPDFTPAAVNSFIKYFYSGETYIADVKELNEFLCLCEIFKFNVSGLEMTDLNSQSENVDDELIESEQHFAQENNTCEILNDSIEGEMFENVDHLEEMMEQPETLEGTVHEQDLNNLISSDKNVKIDKGTVDLYSHPNVRTPPLDDKSHAIIKGHPMNKSAINRTSTQEPTTSKDQSINNSQQIETPTKRRKVR